MLRSGVKGVRFPETGRGRRDRANGAQRSGGKVRGSPVWKSGGAVYHGALPKARR